MPVSPAEAQEFFQQVAAAGSPEEQQALIQDYAANNDNPDEMLAAVVQANPAAAQQIASATAQAIPEQAAEIAGAIAAASPQSANATAAAMAVAAPDIAEDVASDVVQNAPAAAGAVAASLTQINPEGAAEMAAAIAEVAPAAAGAVATAVAQAAPEHAVDAAASMAAANPAAASGAASAVAAADPESASQVATAMAQAAPEAAAAVAAGVASGVAQAAVAVAADSILFVDADDNLVKKEGVGAFATDLAGTGLEQDSNTIRIAAAAAGDGLTGGAGSALAVAVSGAIHVSSDKVSLTGSLAGDCLDKGAGDGVDSIRSLNVVADESTIESAGLSALRLKDDGVTGAKLAPAVAGAGLGQDGSGNLDIGAATNGGISVNTNDIGLDLNDLSAASVAVASDSIAIIDADDSNNTKKESIADLVAAMAGAGLAASAGVLSTQAGTVTQVTASSTALFEGYNYYTASASKSLTLPASPSVGDVVYLKVEDLGDGNALTVNRAGAHLIDGETSVALESDYAAVGFVYLVANKWGII